MTPSSLTSARLLLVATVLASVDLLTSAGSDPKKPANKADIPRARVTDPHGLQFTDVTRPAGMRLVHNNGAFGKKCLPEALGPGCAFIDYDNDGYADILLVNGKGWPGHEAPGGNALRLYHNNRNGTFTDVTPASALGLNIYAIGGSLHDYAHFRFDHSFVTSHGPSPPFPNNVSAT